MMKISEKVTRKFIETIQLSDWEIEADTGWEDITYIHKTIPYYKWKIITESGLFLECADDHIVFDQNYNEIFVKNLIPYKSVIQTKYGPQKIVQLEQYNIKENMYDITVNSTNHRFYSNDILSHNSTLLDAFIFGLYGKSNRGVVKKQLINNINKKDCLVEIDFVINNTSYRIKRGITPNIFEIYVDGQLQNELSAVKDQQKYLENNILKMSYKTFMQVVVLGSTNYVPFMELSSSERRILVEELLDIKIFSGMNLILRDRIRNLESNIREIELERNSINSLIESEKNHVETIRNSGSDMIEKKKKNIDIIEVEIEKIIEDNLKIESELNDLNLKVQKITFNPKKLKQFLSLYGRLQQKTTSIKTEISFFKDHSVCPTCTQTVNEDFKNIKFKDLDSSLQSLIDGQNEIQLEIQKEEKREKEFTQISSQIVNLNSSLTNNQNQIRLKSKQIKDFYKEIEDVREKIENQDDSIQKLRELINDLKKLENSQIKSNELLEYLKFSYILMKDTGIKSKVIENYLPIMNSQINKYLQMMDLYINFHLDSEFKENINTPIHENYSYSSFSEGEKQRINLSLLLAWRDIAKIKNSVNCNIMFFDETLDSSLDNNGIEDLMKIINYIIKDSNILIISHRDGYDDKFDRVLEAKKINGFTKLTSL